MMEQIAEIQGRIAEIEARLAALHPNRNVTNPNATKSVKGATPSTDFSHTLAKIGGNLQLRPVGTGSGPFSPQVEDLIAKHAAKNNLDPAMVRALIMQESGGNPTRESAVGARGLMQLMPDTAAGFGVRDSFDPEQNVAAGTRYLAGLLREFDGDLDKTLAAYNAGPAAVKKAGGIPPFPETQNYVRRIKAMMGR